MASNLRPVVWLGNSLAAVQNFPEAVQKDLGDDLQIAQWGGMPAAAKPFKGVGSGVYELVERFNANTYRAVYAVNLGASVYVLHAFQKKSPKGIKTAGLDVDLIHRRYQTALARAKEEK